jgi:cell division protease FtsH
MNENQDQQTPKRGSNTLTWIGLVLLVILLIWNFWAFFPHSNPQVELPYSDFISQLNTGNVSDVTITGSDITGTFKQPILWNDNTNTLASSASGSPAANTQTATSAPATSGGASASSSSSASSSTTASGVTSYSQFHTIFPEIVGDSTLMSLLRQQGVNITTAQPSTPWLATVLSYGLPLLLLVLVLVWLGRSASQSQSGVLGFGKSKPREYALEHPDTRFEDVAGVEEAKQELLEVVDFLRSPEKYHDIGARVPRGVMLSGPPGTGKTLLARAVAGEAGVPFFSISASEFVEMFVGVGASRVRDLFDRAKAAAPSIVFVDELDAVGRRRGAGLGAVNDEREQTLNQLLVELDGFDDRHEVILLAATNRPDVLDPALLRPGRFDRQITVGLPDRTGRAEILRIHTRHLQLNKDVDLQLLARTTTGFSGADLANLCNEAALIAARVSAMQVNMANFEEALDRIMLGLARTMLLNDHERSVVAYHESGHALTAWMIPAADPVHKVTIIPRGRALGVTEQMPLDDQYNVSREYLIARLTVLLAGRVSEEIALSDITTGAENDLVEATRLARRMVTRWGMGSLGLMVTSGDSDQPFLGYELAQGREVSEQTAAQIDQDVQMLLDSCSKVAHHILLSERDKLDHLVDALLQEETLDVDAINKILGPRPLEAEWNITQELALLHPNS